MNTQPEHTEQSAPEQKHKFIKLDPRVYAVLLRSQHIHPNLAVLMGTEALKLR